MDTKKGELKELLIHWWHYYGKCIYTFQELTDFEKLIDEKGERKILEVALASYLCGDGSNTVLLISMREKLVDKLLSTLPDISKFSPNEKQMYDKEQEEFLNILRSSLYKNN